MIYSFHFFRQGLFEERAILLGKLGRHEQALSIYTNILNDVPAAIDYCNANYQLESPSSREVKLCLIGLTKYHCLFDVLAGLLLFVKITTAANRGCENPRASIS